MGVKYVQEHISPFSGTFAKDLTAPLSDLQHNGSFASTLHGRSRKELTSKATRP
jgi:hypothetical protein